MKIDPSPMPPDELREALNILGWTQAELARQIGVTHGSISHWLVGRSVCEGPAAACIRLILRLPQEYACELTVNSAQ